MSARLLVAGFALGVFLLGAQTSLAANESDRPAKRARPPQWSADDLKVFFQDAGEKLVGPRPDYSKIEVIDSAAASPSETDRLPGAIWSKLIDGDTLETEIKRLAQDVDKDVTTPGDFKGGAYEACRRHFSVLAVLFAVAAEYDGDVRWQDAAPALRDLFSRAGYNCKVGTDQTYQESVNRKQDLADLIGGTRPRLPQAERTAEWGQVADRAPLMQRLNIAHEERLTKWLANQGQFERHRDDVRHEAQLVAMLGDVIGREGFDYWDEEDYAQHARELRQAAIDISSAVELNNYERARQAVGRATKACAACHEVYRG
jgi:hypothetical protein